MDSENPFAINDEKIKNNQLSGKYRHAWVEENFIFDHEHGKQPSAIKTKNFLGSGVLLKKIKLAMLFACLGILIILSRVFFLQIIHGKEYKVSAENNRIRMRPIIAERGLVYDRKERQLINNIPSFSLSVVPQDFPQTVTKRREIIKRVSQISGVPEADIKKVIEKYKDYSYESLTLKENLDYESALSLYIQNADLPGVLIEKGTKRLYLDEEIPSLSHILGYLGKINDEELETNSDVDYLRNDNIGKTGLEKTYEPLLRGIYGQRKIEVNARGVEQNILSETPPEPGKNLILTIDLEAQKALEDILKNHLEKIEKKRGSAIAMDPMTGEIIAMVSWPSFNNNDFSGGIDYNQYQKYIQNPDRPLFNRAISGTYPSGSTVKLIISAAGLEEGIITANTSILSTGGVRIDRWFFPDWAAGGHGITNVTKAIAWSINTFFYYVGGGHQNFTGLGVEKINKYLHEFGLGQPTKIDLPGEAAGLVPNPEWKKEVKDEMWYIGDTYNLSIGQGDLLVTPLQVANWTATVVNGGKVMKPHLLKTVVNPVSKKESEVKPEVLNENFISPYNMGIVKRGMKECVDYATCRSLLVLPFSSGGKTGTAQWSNSRDNHGWFTAFAPYEKPQIVVTAMVEEGEGGTYSATPIVREFLSWWGKNLKK